MAAFDPATVMSAHGPYDGVAGWFAVAGAATTAYHAAGSMPPPAGDPDDLDPADTPAIADYLCALASSTGIECAGVPRTVATTSVPPLKSSPPRCRGWRAASDADGRGRHTAQRCGRSVRRSARGD